MDSNSLSDFKLVWGEISFSLLALMHLSTSGLTYEVISVYQIIMQLLAKERHI